LAVLLLPAQARELLQGPYEARVIDVLGGDTLVVRARIWLGTEMELRVRLSGVDAPELNGRCEAEIRLARDARNALARLVGGGTIRLRNIRYGKYAGRVVARVETERGQDVALSLSARRLVRVYAGGRRPDWCAAR
jgi:endonuclease YncB( thermonuclease family)